jgi:hypothetical protein
LPYAPATSGRGNRLNSPANLLGLVLGFELADDVHQRHSNVI